MPTTTTTKVYITITLYQKPSGWFWFKPANDQPQIIWSSSVVALCDEALKWAKAHYGAELAEPVTFNLARI